MQIAAAFTRRAASYTCIRYIYVNNFHPLEIVGRGSYTHFLVGKKKSCDFEIYVV